MNRPRNAISRGGLVALLAFGVATVLPRSLPAEPAGDDRSRCRRSSLGTPQSWINDGVWVRSVQQALLPNRLESGGILTARLASGSLVDRIEYPTDRFRKAPLAIVGHGSGYLLVNSVTEVDWVASDLSPIDHLNLRESVTGDWVLGSIWGPQVTAAGGYLVAIGSARESRTGAGRSAAGPPKFGVFDYPLPTAPGDDRPGQLREVRPFEAHTFQTSEIVYRLGPKFVTAIGDAAYYLVLESYPRLFEYFPNERIENELTDFPWADKPILKMPEQGRRNAEVAYGWLARQDLPVGLYSQNGFLYALRRSPASDGDGTRWELLQMRPESDASHPSGSVVLPSRAEHVFVLPSPDEWLVFEGGKITGMKTPRQSYDTVVRVPIAEIERSASSPLRASRDIKPRCLE